MSVVPELNCKKYQKYVDGLQNYVSIKFMFGNYRVQHILDNSS